MEQDVIVRKAKEFVDSIKNEMVSYGYDNVYNSDQSGFNLELHAGRTLFLAGAKHVESIVQSKISTTHSYTVQPLISASGKLVSPLLVVLREPSGEFGPRVEQNLFRPENVYIMASKSGKLTTEHFKTWMTEVFIPNTGQKSLLLLDSWSGQCPAVIQAVYINDKDITARTIPAGTTGMIQPLDVFGFRVWKNFVRKFSDAVLLYNYDINLHERNNLIKLQSLVHNQLSSPRYTNLFKYSWFKSGYIEERPPEFENPVEYSFNTVASKCDLCNQVAVFKCGWCKKNLCFKHFFDEYHYCNTYNP
ncbi:hypothetical protein ABEB36_008988 [Hypothenemus hampei]|uniref:Transposase n=1 Tax=Hypothenemus hampei TaxID=57062 RepID=A0ABD1DZF2_HYPHA